MLQVPLPCLNRPSCGGSCCSPSRALLLNWLLLANLCCRLLPLLHSQGIPRAGPAAGGPASAQPGGAAHVSGAVHTAAGRHDWHCVSHVLRHSACLAILPARQCVLCLGSSVPFTHPAPIPPAMCRFQLSPQAAELIGSTDLEGLVEELQACAKLLQGDYWRREGGSLLGRPVYMLAD